MSKKLKSCPFCGGEAELVRGSCNWVYCKSCGMETKVFEAAESAIAAWNRRTLDNETARKEGELNG